MAYRFCGKTKTLASFKVLARSTVHLHHAHYLSQSSRVSTAAKEMGSLHPTVQSLSSYSFPKDRLKTYQNDASKRPVVLVACGSYSPVTTLHLQMFEIASRFIKRSTNFEVMGEYLSPVSDAYKKQGLASSTHRLRMCELAANEKPNSRLMVDPWEALQQEYTPTAQVLDHFHHEINEVLGGARKSDGSRVPMRIMLLAGADLIQTMSTPGLWSDRDLKHILGGYGAFVLKRKGTDIETALMSLRKWKDNIYAHLTRSRCSSHRV